MPRKSPLPRYLCWRDGRPRWVPGPKLRAGGYRGRDLRKADGSWMTLAEAITEADKINTAVDQAQPVETPPQQRTLNALFDAYEASEKFKALEPRTQDDYRQEMKFLRAWSGDVPVGAIKRIDFTELYGKVRAGKSLTAANKLLRVARLTMNFAVNELEWLDRNRAAKMGMENTKGRLVMWTPDEIVAFVRAADWLGLYDQGDAVIMGLCMGQSEIDIITAPELVPENGVYRLDRAKTGITAYIPPTAPLQARLATMRARKALLYPNVRFGTELINSATGRAWTSDAFQKQHLLVRRVAAGLHFAEEYDDAGRRIDLPFTPMPALADKRYQDLRDTAVTMLYDATGDIAKVANITGHSLKTAQEIIDKHYWVRNAGLAIAAGAAYDRLLAGTKIGA